METKLKYSEWILNVLIPACEYDMLRIESHTLYICNVIKLNLKSDPHAKYKEKMLRTIQDKLARKSKQLGVKAGVLGVYFKIHNGNQKIDWLKTIAAIHAKRGN